MPGFLASGRILVAVRYRTRLVARRAGQELTKRCQDGNPCLASVGPLVSLETAALPYQGFRHALDSPTSPGNPSIPAIQPEPFPDTRTALKGAATLIGCFGAIALMGYTRDGISDAELGVTSPFA